MIDDFKLPIEYNKDSKQLDDSLIKELELIETIDNHNISIYDSIFYKKKVKFENDYTFSFVDNMAKTITTDESFLKSTQKLIKNMDTNNSSFSIYESFYEEWKLFKDDLGFKDKYQYIDWEFAEKWNHNSTFLHINAIYNITSPIFSLISPLVLFLIPFIFILIQGYDINITEYLNMLNQLFPKHAITKIFKFNEMDVGQKFYVLLIIGFYILNIYQSILTCIRFYYNSKKISTFLSNTCNYLDNTLKNIRFFKTEMDKNVSGYDTFLTILQNKESQIILLHQQISNNKLSFTNYGTVLKLFYELHENNEYNDLFKYTFYLNNYYYQLITVSEKLKNKFINCAKFNKNNKIIFKQIYYPAHCFKKSVKNNIKIGKNIIITGANASGKTTIVKSILINLILSQQIGCGFYNSLHFTPFDYFYSYINIPDTLGRDSLFQAEARRCKDILDNIKRNGTHFCIFDELYSGTNPVEAVQSANSFIQYLNKNKNVRFLLTTHYKELCNNDGIKNMFMFMQNNNYTYLIKNGINNNNCVSKIFKDLGYPDEIIFGNIFK